MTTLLVEWSLFKLILSQSFTGPTEMLPSQQGGCSKILSRITFFNQFYPPHRKLLFEEAAHCVVCVCVFISIYRP